MDDSEDPTRHSELAPELQFIPLGGLGQIGMNCFALEQNDEILVVDCGAGFPEDDVGEELLVPELKWLTERRTDIAGIFITHGHEDHIGGLPHLLRLLDRPIPIFAPAHAAALIEARLAEQGLAADTLRVVVAGQQYSVGSFLVEPIPVAHSIVEATALNIKTCIGNVVHTADFDLDERQPTGWRTDEKRFKELGDEGVTVLFSDSTNIETEQREYNEGDVAEELMRLVKEAQRRLVVTLFSSNVHRLVALVEAAEASGRRICLLGRSLRRQFDIAADLGHIKYPSNLLVAKEELALLEPEKTLVIASGSQGEPGSALKKISQGSHPHLSLEAGDRLIFSARIIPGNEKRVQLMMNDLLRQEVELISRHAHPRVHVSGHASRAELKRMIEWTRPRGFVPVHGTLMHLRKHQELAKECGVTHSRVVENGQKLILSSEGVPRLGRRVAAGITRLVLGGAVMDGLTRRRRFELARSGVILISFRLNNKEELVSGPQLTAHGLIGIDQEGPGYTAISAAVRECVAQAKGRRMRSLETSVAQAVRSLVLSMCGVRPVVVVHVFGEDDIPSRVIDEEADET